MTRPSPRSSRPKVKASQAITLLLGDDNKLYYYEGEPNYKDYTSLKETTYQADGLRAMLLQRNRVASERGEQTEAAETGS